MRQFGTETKKQFRLMGDDEKGSPDINSELTMTAAQIADAASIDE